jgi:hypothetical protein
MRPARASVLTLGILFTSAAAAGAWAPTAPGSDIQDWVRLSSGEWVRGTVELLHDETLSFDSEGLDDLELDWGDVVEIRSSRILTVGLYDGTVVSGPLLMRDGVLTVGAGDGARRVDRANVRTFFEGEPREINYWSFRATANIVARSGNTQQYDVNSYVRVRRQSTASRPDFEYQGNYGSTEGIETVRNSRLAADANIFLTRKLFVTPVSADFFEDRFQNIALRTGVGAGFGYYLLRAATDWRITAGGGWQRTNYESVGADEDRSIDNGTVTLGTVLETDITSTIELDAEYNIRRTIGPDERTLHRVYTMVAIDLFGDVIDFNASLTWDYNSNPKANADGQRPEKSDLTMAYGLGVDF